jgi:hypothetical protein
MLNGSLPDRSQRDFLKEVGAAECHHEGVLPLMYDEHEFPPGATAFLLCYPTHCTGMVLPVTGECLAEVTAIGWGDGH